MLVQLQFTMAESRQRKFVLLCCPVLPMMIPALVHFMFDSLATLTSVSAHIVWPHLVLLAVAFWTALERKRYEPVVCFMVALVTTAIFDIVLLALTFSAPAGRSTFNAGLISAVFVIINLLGKPVTLILSILALYSRRESFRITLGRNMQPSSTAEAQTPIMTPEDKPVCSTEYRAQAFDQPTSYSPPLPATKYVPSSC